MWDVNIAFWEATGVFVVACECADPACVETVEITPRQYEDVRRNAHAFVIARAHAGDVDPIEEHRNYVVAELPVEVLAEVAAGTNELEFPSHHFRALVEQLLDALPAEGREDALHRAGQRFGRHLGVRARLYADPDVARGLRQICSAVRSLGFHAALRDVDGDTAVIVTPTCPLRQLVEERVEAVAIDRGMWIGLVEHGLRDVTAADLACETQGCLDRGEPCAITLRLARRDRASA